ncbi:hypothetical protein CHUAL_008233 [Chamberlinius hualienensis]
MGKYYENHSDFKFSWDQVAQAFWCRYPNPFSNHVLSEDVICREVRDNKLYSKRLLTKTNHLPEWGKRFMTSRAICIVEESVVDPIQRTIVTYTRNIGFNRVMNVEEKCTYRQINENDNQWTQIQRQAYIESGVFGFAKAIQAFGIDRFRKNSLKATKGYLYVLNKMFCPEKPIEQPALLLLDTTKLKETAMKATELAKSSPLVAAATASCTSNKQ